jgi:hypothetical protein
MLPNLVSQKMNASVAEGVFCRELANSLCLRYRAAGAAAFATDVAAASASMRW